MFRLGNTTAIPIRDPTSHMTCTIIIIGYRMSISRKLSIYGQSSKKKKIGTNVLFGL